MCVAPAPLGAHPHPGDGPRFFHRVIEKGGNGPVKLRAENFAEEAR